jgi:hypothetical protein
MSNRISDSKTTKTRSVIVEVPEGTTEDAIAAAVRIVGGHVGTSLRLEADHIIALDDDGKTRARSFLVGHEFRENSWPREDVLAACQASGLPLEVVTPELRRIDMFRRACKYTEKRFGREQNTLKVRLESGVDFELNAHVDVEFVPVDGERTGTEYQVNRTIQWFVPDIERVLPMGVTKELLMRAVSARGDTNHKVTQNIGKIRLHTPASSQSIVEQEESCEETTVEGVVYARFQNDPTHARAFFERILDKVLAHFETSMASSRTRTSETPGRARRSSWSAPSRSTSAREASPSSSARTCPASKPGSGSFASCMASRCSTCCPS